LKYLFLAGIGNSDGSHWQRQWHDSLDNTVWIEHKHWEKPVCNEWVSDLNNAIASIDDAFVVVAHSLGCLLFTDWASNLESEFLKGAFLVAFPDVTGKAFPSQAIGFSNPASDLSHIPITIVASTNDPYGSLPYVKEVADAMGASIHEIGGKGHINSDSDIGEWVEGKRLFNNFLTSLNLDER
jgi:predicted alpha/beta hydrolase family esterase